MTEISGRADTVLPLGVTALTMLRDLRDPSSAGVEEFTEEVENSKYAPLSWALGGNGEIYLRGALKNTAAVTSGGTLFTLPAEADPHFRQAVWVGNAGSANLTEGEVVVVQPGGVVETPAGLAAGKDPSFDGVQFSTAD